MLFTRRQILPPLMALAFSADTAIGSCGTASARGFDLADRLLSSNEPVEDAEIQAALGKVIDRHPIPGVVAAIAKFGQPLRIAAAGVRKFGETAALTIDDQMHLGSCTKAMTASLIGRLVDQAKVGWNDRLGDLLPELSQRWHSEFRQVSLIQLLTHHSGVPANAKDWWLRSDEGDLSKIRQEVSCDSLQDPPVYPPGKEYLYSNLGYLLVGLVVEKITGLTWEQAMRTEVFEVLDLRSAGFGIPGTLGTSDQPWGHRWDAPNLRAIQADNAPALGPAGTVYLSFADWSRFALVHAVMPERLPESVPSAVKKTESLRSYLSKSTLQMLHQPYPAQAEASSVACGWMLAQRQWAGGLTLHHSGSNTMWLCQAWLAPKQETAYLVGCNVAGEGIDPVIDSVFADLISLA